MGRSKALLRLEGSTFVRRVVGLLAGAGCRPVVVVAAAGDEEVASEARASGAEVVVNPDPGEGPITSLRLAIALLSGTVDGMLWLPVDHPAVLPETVEAVLAAARRQDADLALPVFEGRRGHPAYFGATLFGELTDPALPGGARTVVHRHLAGAALVEVSDRGVTTDVDTPREYEALVSSRGAGARTAR
jgi:CTP:molybdopterin cytidylyltransferase MocA